jgi:ubiquinone biosynthesis accessory factor UbiK
MNSPKSTAIAALTELAAHAEKLLKASPASELEKNARQHFISQLAKHGLVTREEYEIQTALLKRAEAKLKELEAKISALEQTQKRAHEHVQSQAKKS